MVDAGRTAGQAPAVHRNHTTLRTLAATVGGYGIAALVCLAGAAAHPPMRAEALQWAMLAAPLLWPALWIWTFGTARPARLWFCLLCGGGLVLAGIWAVGTTV